MHGSDFSTDARRRSASSKSYRLTMSTTINALLLLLFDIDGTLLLKASLEHVEAMHAALRDVHGVTEPARVEAAGRTDIEIARQICVLAGVPAVVFDARLGELLDAAPAHYAEMVPEDISARVAPGIPDLLEALAARDDALLSLVTGNIEPVARMKLRAAGIGGRFAAGQGGFGSDNEDRTYLPAIARARAGGDGAPHPRGHPRHRRHAARRRVRPRRRRALHRGGVRALPGRRARGCRPGGAGCMVAAVGDRQPRVARQRPEAVEADVRLHGDVA